VQIDGVERAPGRFDRRVALLVVEVKLVVETLRAAGGALGAGEGVRRVAALLRFEGDDEGDVVGIDVEEAGLRIEGGAGPGGAAVPGGRAEGALQAAGGEGPLGPQGAVA